MRRRSAMEEEEEEKWWHGEYGGAGGGGNGTEWGYGSSRSSIGSYCDLDEFFFVSRPKYSFVLLSCSICGIDQS